MLIRNLPLKKSGAYDVIAKLHPEVTATIKVVLGAIESQATLDFECIIDSRVCEIAGAYEIGARDFVLHRPIRRQNLSSLILDGPVMSSVKSKKLQLLQLKLLPKLKHLLLNNFCTKQLLKTLILRDGRFFVWRVFANAFAPVDKCALTRGGGGSRVSGVGAMLALPRVLYD